MYKLFLEVDEEVLDLLIDHLLNYQEGMVKVYLVQERPEDE